MDRGGLEDRVQWHLLCLPECELGLGENGARIWNRVDRIHYQRGR